MPIQTTNPTTGTIEQTFTPLTPAELTQKIETAAHAYEDWKQRSFSDRAVVLKETARILRERKERYGALITTEMGKPKAAAEAEVDKSARVCEYYAEEAETMLALDTRENAAKEAFVRFDPIGVVLAVMPWNFPFWQVLRFAAPALMAGNVGLLKHASNVPQCSLAIEEAFRDAGAPAGVFTSLLIESKAVESVIRHPAVQAVALTGSEKAGASVAAIAGSEIKKSLLELGGSDPFIVRADADIEKTAKAAVEARFQNSGQSCIAGKRFIVHHAVAEAFLAAFVKETEKLVVGDPSDPTITTGPVVDEAALATLKRQIDESVAAGAVCVSGGDRLDRPGSFLAPTILSHVTTNMPVYAEETFGPIAAVIIVQDDVEAIKVANDSRLGLASSIWTKDIEAAKTMAAKVDAGSVFINTVVVSDILLPFGGTKRSGYGRELGREGIFEFVNVKTVKINQL